MLKNNICPSSVGRNECPVCVAFEDQIAVGEREEAYSGWHMTPTDNLPPLEFPPGDSETESQLQIEWPHWVGRSSSIFFCSPSPTAAEQTAKTKVQQKQEVSDTNLSRPPFVIE